MQAFLANRESRPLCDTVCVNHGPPTTLTQVHLCALQEVPLRITMAVRTTRRPYSHACCTQHSQVSLHLCQHPRACTSLECHRLWRQQACKQAHTRAHTHTHTNATSGRGKSWRFHANEAVSSHAVFLLVWFLQLAAFGNGPETHTSRSCALYSIT